MRTRWGAAVIVAWIAGCGDEVGCVACPDTCASCDVPGAVQLVSAQPDAHQEEPSAAVLPDGRVVVAWKEMPEPATVGSLGLAWSDDGGRSWSAGELPHGPGEPGQSDPWLAARSSGRLIAARYQDCQVGVATSDDGGVGWSDWNDLHRGEGCADKPSLTSRSDGPLYLVYHVIEPDGESVRIAIAGSDDDGATWATPSTVAPTSTGIRIAPSSAVLDDGGLVVAWWRSDTGDVEVSRSESGGEAFAWTDPVRVNPAAGSVPRVSQVLARPPFPSVAASGSGVVVAWPDRASGDWDVLTARSTDGGRSWATPRALPGGRSGDQWMVGLAAGPGRRLHAAWYDSSTGPTELRYATSDDGGATWTMAGVEGGVVPEDRARLGDYLAVAVGTDGAAFLAWTAVRSDSLRVFASPSSGLGVDP